MSHILRPSAEAADHFQIAHCDDPNCGIHIIALRKDDTPICEIVMTPQITRDVIEHAENVLYQKATERDG